MFVLTSHLIIGYEGFSLISDLLCQGKCLIKSQMKFLSNPNEKFPKKNFFSFLKSLSLFSCFYGIYPGEYTQIYLFNYYLIHFYLSILLISEKIEFRNLMQIFGLHPFISWTSRFFFDFILTIIYSFYLYLIFSFDHQDNINENSMMTFEYILKKNNLKMKKDFFLFSFLLPICNLPFIYLITSKNFFSNENIVAVQYEKYFSFPKQTRNFKNTTNVVCAMELSFSDC